MNTPEPPGPCAHKKREQAESGAEKETPTPRTDAFRESFGMREPHQWGLQDVEKACDFADGLERELATAQALYSMWMQIRDALSTAPTPGWLSPDEAERLKHELAAESARAEGYEEEIGAMKAKASTLEQKVERLKREVESVWKAHGDMFAECATAKGDLKRELATLTTARDEAEQAKEMAEELSSLRQTNLKDIYALLSARGYGDTPWLEEGRGLPRLLSDFDSCLSAKLEAERKNVEMREILIGVSYNEKCAFKPSEIGSCTKSDYPRERWCGSCLRLEAIRKSLAFTPEQSVVPEAKVCPACEYRAELLTAVTKEVKHLQALLKTYQDAEDARCPTCGVELNIHGDYCLVGGQDEFVPREIADELAERVLKVLKARKGFDYWWSDIDGEYQQEIRAAINEAAYASTKPSATTEREGKEWHPMDTAPRDGSTILGKYGDEEALVCWSDRPVCMLGSRAGGYPPGWATPVGGDTDSNLPMDAPEAWKPEQPSNGGMKDEHTR